MSIIVSDLRIRNPLQSQIAGVHVAIVSEMGIYSSLFIFLKINFKS